MNRKNKDFVNTGLGNRGRIEADAEMKFKKSESKYCSLMAHIPLITYIANLDLSGTKLHIGPQVEEILGFSPSEFEKDPDLWISRIHPEDRPWVTTALQSSHGIDQPSTLEYRMYSKTGRLVWFRDEAVDLRDDTDNPHFLQRVMFDITERKNTEEALQKAYAKLEERIAERTTELRKMIAFLKKEISEHKKTENALRASEEKFKALAENAPDLILRLDRDLRYVYSNPVARQILRISADTWIGKTSEELGLPGSVCRLWNKAFRKVFQTGKLETMEFSIKTAKGWKIYQLRITPEFTQGGQVGSVMGVARDITKLKKAEKILKRDKETFEKLVQKKSEELLKTEKKLVDAKRLSNLGALAATVAHELRNPLSVIRTAAYNIKRKRRNPSIDKHLANIEKNVSESNQIINNLLFYARIKIPHFECINIIDILNESIVSVKERYNTRKVRVHRRFKSIESLSIEADPLHLKEMCVNILNNAYDAVITKGMGQIGIKAVWDDKDCIQICFKDNGEGIKKKDLKYVFDPFFSTKSKGTGLGLTVCKQIIHLHAGQIKIERPKGGGTTVILILPIKQKATKGKCDS